MKLNEIIKRKAEINFEISVIESKYKSEKTPLVKEYQELNTLQRIGAENIDTDIVVLAESILKVYGDPYGQTDGVPARTIAECAISDLATGCKHLRKEFYGNKQYSGFYQRCDCEYGYGPSHGSTVDYIGLRNQDKELSPEEQDACIYYLMNYKKIAEAKKKEKA